MSGRAAPSRTALMWAGLGFGLIVAIGTAGMIGSQATQRSTTDELASSSLPPGSTAPATTIVYLTVPRTTAAPATSNPPTTVIIAAQAPPMASEEPATSSVPPAVQAPEDDGDNQQSGPRAFTFPVLADSTKYASTHHDYPAADMFAPCGSPVVAVTDGVIDDVSTTDQWEGGTDDPALRSGLFVGVVDSQDVRYYASHLASVSVEPGQRVSRGDPIGTVGDTGNAAGTGCHVHFGLSPACLTGWQNRRGLTAPQPFLDDWRAGGQRDPSDVVGALGCG